MNAIVKCNSEISVREKPSAKSKKIASLYDDTKIEVIGEIDNEYALMRVEGYAYSEKGRYLKPLSAVPIKPEPAKPKTFEQNGIVTCNTKISLRTGRSSKYPQVKGYETLKRGQPVQVLDDDLDEDYVHVRLPDLTEGYAYGDEGRYIKFLPPAPSKDIDDKIKAFLDIVKSCVGGKYVLGGQGHKITTEYIKSRIKAHPDYFDGNRDKMLLGIAEKCEKAGKWIFPEDYCWDCSGLFWYAADKLDLFGTSVKDATAHGTYHSRCVPIKETEIRAGDCVFYYSKSSDRITHMGIVGENGVVYEAASGYVGVVMNDDINDRTMIKLAGVDGAGKKLTKKVWNRFGRPKCFVG